MRIFVTRKIPQLGLDIMLGSGLELDVWPHGAPPSYEVILERVRGCSGILSLLSDRIDGAVMDAAGPELKVISNFAVGYDNIDVEEAARRGIAVGNTPDVLTEATADLAFSLLIAAARRIGEAQQYVKDGAWKTWEPRGHVGQDLVGKTIGIYGMGRIGSALARRCVGGWNMNVVYCARTPKSDMASELGALKVDFETLLEVSDFVSAHAPLTDETRGVFGEDAFRKMKASAVFINTARGALHDQGALYQALKAGEIFSAGLDVTVPEPMGPHDPLLSLPNCVVLPHIGSATIDSREAMANIAADNVIFGVTNKPLRCAVTPW